MPGRGDVERADELQRPANALGVEAREGAADSGGGVPLPAAGRLQPERLAGATWRERAEQRGRAVEPLRVRRGERKPCVRPVLRKRGLEAPPLPGEAYGGRAGGHAAQHRLRPVAKVESKRGSLSEERLRDFLREMLLIRHFEEKVEERFRAGELPGFLHVAIGQEAVAVGVCRAMEDGDVFASTHRAHGAHARARHAPRTR